MEIIRERLSREYDLDFLMTVPSVTYKVEVKSGEVIEVKSPRPRTFDQVENDPEFWKMRQRIRKALH